MTSVALRAESGRVLRIDGERWLAAPSPADDRLLALVHGPVLDVGCGPGRHVLALARRGVVTLGIDISLPALALARRGGAPVLHRSIFERVPAGGRWGTALLLDGNLGIGGCPRTLLRRVRGLLAPDGRLLVEVARPEPGRAVERVRFEADGVPGPWFSWLHVTAEMVEPLARGAGLGVVRQWRDGDRWFAWLG